MKQTFTKDSIRQTAGGHIHLLDEKGNSVYSTNSEVVDMGIPHLDRKAFVKPVDLEAMAKEYASSQGDNARNYAVAHDWLCGRNSNPNEFTREEAQALFNEGCRQGTGNYAAKSFDECVYILKPLSIPGSVTIENNQVIEILW